jgi:hypothetical protein
MGGMFERLGTLYANCYDFTDSKIYAASLGGIEVYNRFVRLPLLGHRVFSSSVSMRDSSSVRDTCRS